jgi:hypothetical protein
MGTGIPVGRSMSCFPAGDRRQVVGQFLLVIPFGWEWVVARALAFRLERPYCCWSILRRRLGPRN